MSNIMERPAGISEQTWSEAMSSQTNPVTADYHKTIDYSDFHTLRALSDAGGHVSRIRVLADNWGGQGYMCDVSYVHGVLPNGQSVPIAVPLEAGSLYGPKGLKSRLIDWAKDEGVYAKGLGMLDETNWSVLK